MVFVIDIAARDKWNTSISTNELERLLAEPSLIGLPLLILGNKADLLTAMTQNEVEELVNLKSIQRTREASVRLVSATKHATDATPIKDSFSWLKQQINDSKQLPSQTRELSVEQAAEAALIDASSLYIPK